MVISSDMKKERMICCIMYVCELLNSDRTPGPIDIIQPEWNKLDTYMSDLIEKEIRKYIKQF